MAQFALHKAYYRPGLDVVSITVEAIAGPFKGVLLDLYTTQEALTARADGGVWDDSHLIDEARALLEAQGEALVHPWPEPTLAQKDVSNQEGERLGVESP